MYELYETGFISYEDVLAKRQTQEPSCACVSSLES